MISRPDSVIAGSQADIEIKAVRADQSIIEEARHNLLCHFTTSAKTETMAVEMKEGTAKLSKDFTTAGLVLFQVIDKSDENLSGSGFLRVLVAPQPVKQ